MGKIRHLQGVGFIAGILFMAGAASAVEIHWTNTLGGAWSDPVNWSPNQVPGVTNQVYITAPGTYVVDLDTDAAVGQLTVGAETGRQTLLVSKTTLQVADTAMIDPRGVIDLTSGALEGGDWTVAGTLNWTGGRLYKDFVVTPTGQLILSGTKAKELDKVGLVNNGTIHWEGSGKVLVSKTSDLVNYGLMEISAAQPISDKKGSSTVVNFGDLRLSGSGEFNPFDAVVFENYGVIDVGEAVLALNANGWGGAHVFGDGSRIVGAGRLALRGANVEADGVVELGVPLELSAGWLSSKDVWWQGTTFVWTGGGFYGHFVFPTNMTLSITGAATKYLYQAALENYGTINLNSAGPISGDKQPGILNYGVFNLVDAGSFILSGSGPALLNAGELNFAGSLRQLTSQFDFVQTAAGRLNLVLAGKSNGQIDRLNLAGNAVLDGTLNLLLVGNYEPQLGDRLEIITCAFCTGRFARLNGAGDLFRLGYASDHVTLVADAPGFVVQPRSQTVLELADVQFEVHTDGPAQVQWHFNGQALPGQTNMTLELSQVPETLAGAYQVLAWNHWGASTSAVALLTVQVPPAILQPPLPQTVTAGADVALTVLARGTDLRYQWNKDGNPLAGATNATLLLPAVQKEQAGKYRVELQSPLGSLSSSEAMLTVIVPPTITAHPQDKYADPGQDITLEVRAEGTAPLSYLWFKDGNPIFNSNDQRLHLGHATKTMNGVYSVVVANAASAVQSQPATVLVKEPPAIVQQPSSQSVSAGDTVVLAVTATGVPPPTYQWRRNGANIPGATESTLVLTKVQPADAGRYSVVVKNDRGTVVSAVAEIEVLVPWLPFADMFADRGLLYTLSGAGRGTNTLATKEAGEKDHKGKGSAESSLWISWWAPANGIATFTTAGSDFDTVMAVYQGDTLATLNKLADDDDGAPYNCSQVSFNARAGMYYQIVVSGHHRARGKVMLSWNLEQTTEMLPEIVEAPRDQTVNTHDTVTLGIVFTAFEPTAIQWFYQGQALPGANQNALVIPDVQADKVGGYAVRLTAASGRTVVSPPGDLQINTEGVVQAAARNKLSDALDHALNQ